MREHGVLRLVVHLGLELVLVSQRDRLHGGGAGADNGDFGSAGPTASRERKPAMAGAGGKRDDMDDEIPF